MLFIDDSPIILPPLFGKSGIQMSERHKADRLETRSSVNDPLT
jgi:hypothetical protein